MSKLHLIITIFVLLFSFGCEQTPEEREKDLESVWSEQGTSNLVLIKKGSNYQIFQLGKCYYVKFGYADNSETSWGGHYGLCPNPIHRFMNPDSINANITLPDTINVANPTPSLLKDSTVLYKLKPNSQ